MPSLSVPRTLVVAPLLVLGLTATPPPATADIRGAASPVLSRGHIDVAAKVSGGRLHLLVRDTTRSSRPVWRQPGAVTLRVPAAARTKVPAAPAFRFLGSAGTPLWVLPQVQRPTLLWPGWYTKSLSRGQVRGPVVWRLARVRGPGAFSLYTSGTFGAPRVLFDSDDRKPDRVSVPVGTHAHGNWAFSARGTYRLTFIIQATSAAGKKLSDTETLTVRVG